MKEWLTPTEILPFAGCSLPSTQQGLSALILRENWNSDSLRARIRFGRGGGYEYHLSLLPTDVQARIYACELKDTNAAKASALSAAIWKQFERLPQTAKDKAHARLKAVEAVERFGSNIPRQMAVSRVAIDFKLSPATLWNWLKLASSVDRSDRLPVLAPRYTGRTAQSPIDPSAWDYLVADYLRPERPVFEACFRRLQKAALEHGWQPIPSLKTLKRRVETEFPNAVRTLARDGENALKRMMPAQRRDKSVFHAIQAVNADGHIFDTRVEYEDGEIGRPVLLAFQDIYSGAILAHRIDRTENKEAVRLALSDLVSTWGIPEICFFDNGRHFASKWLTGGMKHRFRFKIKDEDPQGILTALGVEVHFTTPYHGQAKPIERAFRDLSEDIAKHPVFMGAYTGKSTVDKPANYGSKAVPIQLFREVVAAEITAHNMRVGRKSSTARGRSFMQTLQESLNDSATLIRRATKEQQRMLLMAAEGVTVRKPDAHIELQSNRYWHDALIDHMGSKVIVRFDPQNLSQAIAVYTLDNRFICEADSLGDVAFNSVEDARQWARLTKERTKAIKAQLSAEKRLDDAMLIAQTPQTPSETPEPPKVIKLLTAASGARSASSDWRGADDFGRGVALMSEVIF